MKEVAEDRQAAFIDLLLGHFFSILLGNHARAVEHLGRHEDRALTRLGYDERTRRYVSRRSAEALSKPEIIRCLKRYVAREMYRALVSALGT